MNSASKKVTANGSHHRIITACFIACLLSACTVVGPGSIRSGRMAYNQAITETNAQQMLMVAVHNRYEESHQLLNVASVTANVRITSKAQVEAGFGNSDNFDGNLVPFSGGFIYEENPTISYQPVTGEAYLRQLASPVPLPLFAQLVQRMPNPEFVYDMLLTRMNDIYNAAFLYDQQQDDPRFQRLVELMTGLTHDRTLHWVSTADDSDALSIMLQTPGGANAQAKELLQLLGQESFDKQAPRHVIPVSVGLGNAGDGSIAMSTRSLWELVELFSAAVQIPEDAATMAASFPRLGKTGRSIAVRYSAERPDQAYVMVQYRDGWYYIDAHDQATKRYFKMLGNLWSAAISESLDDTSASPVLTVPVSR